MNSQSFYDFCILLVYPVIAHAVWSSNGFLSNSSETPLLGTGMIDFAGSGVVHVTGGFTALIATKLLGARKGRFYDDRGCLLEEPKTFPGHSKSLQVSSLLYSSNIDLLFSTTGLLIKSFLFKILGTFILWFGWIGFNGGSAISADGTFNPVVVSVAVVNTILSGAASGITALFANLIYTERLTGEPLYNLSFAMNGCLTGLAAITGR